MRRDADVVVVGAGVAGLTLAYELSGRGADVMLLERATGPAGASTVPVALLNPHRGRTARATASDVTGLTAFWRLAARLGEEGPDPGAAMSGVLRVAASERQASLWRAVAAAGEEPGSRASPERDVAAPGGATVPGHWSQGTLWLDDPPAPLHGPYGGLRIAKGGYVEPARLLAALTEASRRRGARVVPGSPATSVRSTGTGAEVAVGGSLIRAAHVVVCTGVWPFARRRPTSLRQDGGLAVTVALPGGWRGSSEAKHPAGVGLAVAGAVNAVSWDDRAVITGGALPPVRPSAPELARAAEELVSRAAWSQPWLASSRIVDVWFGVRARRPSGAPAIRRVAPGVTFFGALAGRGFLCSADVAARLADRLAGAGTEEGRQGVYATE